MAYDLVDEIRLQPYRMNQMKDCDMWSSHEQPDNAKWRNGDCVKCNKVFCVVPLYRKGKQVGKMCLNCGWEG